VSALSSFGHWSDRLRLQIIDKFQCPLHETSQLLRINHVRSPVLRILTMMVIAAVLIDLLKFVHKIPRRMLLASFLYFFDHPPKSVIGFK
jgi:hypothetical protein